MCTTFVLTFFVLVLLLPQGEREGAEGERGEPVVPQVDHAQIVEALEGVGRQLRDLVVFGVDLQRK